MSELAPLISDLALILICAGVMTLVFKRLKQPLVLGYIVAGFLASPHFTLTFSHRYGKYPYLVGDWSHFFALCIGLRVQFQETDEGRRNSDYCSMFHHLLYDSDWDDGGMVVRMEINGLSLFRGDAGHVIYDYHL